MSSDAVGDRDGLQLPRAGYGARSMANPSLAYGPRGGASYTTSGAPGSFSSELRSTMVSRATNSRPDFSSSSALDAVAEDEKTMAEERVARLRDKLSKELKIKAGSENLLEALNSKKAKQTKEQRSKVELELNTSNRKIGQLRIQIEELQNPKEQQPASRRRMSELFRGELIREGTNETFTGPDLQSDEDVETESPTFVLAEILQALENEGMQPDYYVERANSLVELFKRHPTLKYDLVWSVFGLRMQTLLLSDSREIIAAGYRVTRYAITDRASLKTIRSLSSDYLVILSLVKEGKASVEREQALKLVRAFLDVKGGVHEVSRAVIRTMVAVAEHTEDRLRNICILTLAEILVRHPPLLVSGGGVGPLTEILGDGSYEASESLVTAFLYQLDLPSRRKYLKAGHGLEIVFSVFTDSLSGHCSEQKLKMNARVIAAVLSSWSGLTALSMNNFRALRSLFASLRFPDDRLRVVILDLIFDVLRIETPSWSSSFLAGRRLTTYGRVANLKSDKAQDGSDQNPTERKDQPNLIDHYLCLLLAVLFEAGMLEGLMGVLRGNPEPVLKRKTTLLVGELLKMASRLLPSAYSTQLQMLPELFASASLFGDEDRFNATGTVYQIDSVNRTLFRSGAPTVKPSGPAASTGQARDASNPSEQAKSKASAQIDEAQFRSLMLDSQVLNSANYTKWRWDLLQNIVEGPLLNPKRLDEAVRVTKFMKRLVGFYRPFKYRFADVKNTKPNQRYIRIGSSLIRTLLKTSEGVKYLSENKLLRQIAECLAQLDRMSGLTSISPLFSASRMTETLTGGYFTFIGILSSDPNGLIMLERWRMINMCYHIIELKERPDLVKVLLGNIDFTLDSHFRVMLSKALTASAKDIRIFATNQLRRYVTYGVTAPGSTGREGNAEWAMRLLVTQLYDPAVEVCETAVKILEEACDDKDCLEFIVKCRPALDHLGEIGAPLLLQFLSTSHGYRYLDGLDYITQEMDDWFLGRNDTYVALVEASIARGIHDSDRIPIPDNSIGRANRGVAPPHFYRELTRTAEGCRLLEEKGHFGEFAATIRDYGMEKEDAELILKVKGCMWAVGNVGSMENGASFLESTDVVQSMVKIAEGSEVMTLRGTAFFALGLISRSVHGLEILDECGWDGATSLMGDSLGLCIPLDLKRLFSIAPWSHRIDAQSESPQAEPAKLDLSQEDPTNVRIIRLVVDLANTVLTKRAVSDLMHIKAKKPVGFRSPSLFHKVMSILECRHYRLPVRRFIIDLFEKSVMRQIVLEEDDSDNNDVETNNNESENDPLSKEKP
ncbi:MAG: hypothetical protein M1825_004943 [Sarcosagium campestre]|nr:MAG: hypothetical protein M1825_004943 [Sarcosagium campestre]